MLASYLQGFVVLRDGQPSGSVLDPRVTRCTVGPVKPGTTLSLQVMAVSDELLEPGGLLSPRHRLCSHGLESRSERCFGSRSKTWLGSWFELHGCIYMHCKRLPNHDQDLRTARFYFAPTAQSVRADWPMRLCMALARILKMHTHESRSKRALRSHVLESGFLGGSRSKMPFFSRFKTCFKSLIWNSFACTWANIRLSDQERAESRSETSFGTWF